MNYCNHCHEFIDDDALKYIENRVPYGSTTVVESEIPVCPFCGDDDIELDTLTDYCICCGSEYPISHMKMLDDGTYVCESCASRKCLEEFCK